ncbi:MAG: hypothetical protein ACOCU5_01380 [Bacillota bacterium]
MSENNRVTQRLEKDFKGVVEKILESEDRIRNRYQLFDTNKEAIKASIKESLKNHAFNLDLLERTTEANKDAHRKAYKTTLNEIDSEEKDSSETFEKDMASLQENLDKKKELSRMKAQKSQSDYDFAVKKATEVKLDIQKKADEVIDQAIEDHSERVSDLERETNIRYVVNANRLEHERLDFNHTYKTIKETYKSKYQAKHDDLKKAEDEYRKAIKARLKTHEETMRPLNSAIDTLKAKQEKALKSVQERQANELSKQQSYRNEAKKLNDSAQLNKIDKTIKQLKKSHEATLKQTKDQQTEALRPRLEERDKVLKSEREAIKALKMTHIHAIEEALHAIEQVKTDEKIAIDEANKTYNQAVAEYDQGKQAIRIDHDVQMLNFDQSRDEIELDRTHEKTIAQPESDLKENEAALYRNKADAEREASDKIADAEFTRDKTKRTLDQDQAIQSFERDRNEARYIKDHALRDTEIHAWLKRYEKDYDHQAMLVDHYRKESENYTALKNDLIRAKKPAVDREVQNWIKRKTDEYEGMIEDAKKDHERMVESIERTYDNERAIYQKTYDTILKNHEQIIENMMTEHALERNRAVEAINRLDEKKGKKIKKQKDQLKQELNQKQEAHDEALYKKKKALEKKRAIYQDMLSTIENKRNQSLEEAKTLLYHLTDQLNTHINTLGRLSKEATRSFSDLSYATKHRAHLFNTFQHDRTYETMDKAKDYINTRIHRAKSEKTDNDARMTDYINALNKDYQAASNAIDEKKREADQTYKETLEAIEQEKTDALQKLEAAFKDEKRRLELHITKLTKDHEVNKQNLKNQTNMEKENFFKEKENSEHALEREKERLEKAFEEDRRAMLDELENLRGERLKLKDSLESFLEEDAIENLPPSQAPDITSVLKKEKDLTVFENETTTT